MAAQKPPKAELIAIYRLEFYKKQKNWKLSADTKREKEIQNSHPAASVKISNILNETYSIQSNIETNASVLNDAFLKDDSDKEAPVSTTARTSLCTQWLEPINACEECCQYTEQKPQNPWADYVVDGWPGSTEVVDKCSGDGNDFEGFDGWAEGMVWTNSGIPQVGWTGDVAAPINIQGAKSPDQIAWPEDTILYPRLDWPDDQMWAPHIWGENEVLAETLESIDEFMIGAHNAPHSSEVDLSVSEYEGEEIKVDEGSVGRMSGPALAAAVRRHSGSLRRLLREAGQRRKYRSTLSLDVCAPDHNGLAPRSFFSTDYSYEAFPTKDIPFTPLSPVYPHSDVLTLLPPTNQRKDDFVPLPVTNQCKDHVTPLVPTIQYKDVVTPLPLTKQFKDGFTPMSLENQCTDGFIPPPTTNPCMRGFIQLPPTRQSQDSFTLLSPANLYRDGFLAGSYRNKVPTAFVGRGRGRLREDGGVEA